MSRDVLINMFSEVVWLWKLLLSAAVSTCPCQRNAPASRVVVGPCVTNGCNSTHACRHQHSGSFCWDPNGLKGHTREHGNRRGRKTCNFVSFAVPHFVQILQYPKDLLHAQLLHSNQTSLPEMQARPPKYTNATPTQRDKLKKGNIQQLRS